MDLLDRHDGPSFIYYCEHRVHFPTVRLIILVVTLFA